MYPCRFLYTLYSKCPGSYKLWCKRQWRWLIQPNRVCKLSVAIKCRWTIPRNEHVLHNTEMHSIKTRFKGITLCLRTSSLLLSFLSLLPLPSFSQSVQRRATAWKIGVRFLARARDFSPLYSVQTGSGPTQPPLQWVPGAVFPGGKWPGLEADLSPSWPSAEVKNGGAIPPLPHIFMA
jgi:hypothetical protein